MIPDLGKYALWVLASYGVAIGLLGAITLASIRQARRTRRALREMEAGRQARRAPADADGRARSAPAREAADG